MTSSLVGSEMCIRDRIYPGDCPLAIQRLVQMGKRRVAREWATIRCTRACLLYTSDAADDM
eukprot:7765438-Prorocentrum_lima.AAC.1